MTLDWFGIGISCIWLGQCDDHSNVQIAVGPAVQAMADTGSKGIILNFQFGEIDPLAFPGCLRVEDLFPVARAPPA